MSEVSRTMSKPAPKASSLSSAALSDSPSAAPSGSQFAVSSDSPSAAPSAPQSAPQSVPQPATDSAALSASAPGRVDKPDPLAIHGPLVEAMLTRFIRSELTRAGFPRAVLGLSGGIDSTVVAYLAARALGPENVLAVAMPYKTSSGASLADAQRVADCLGVRLVEIPITAQIDAYFARFPDASRLRLANKCARERMTILYDQSAAYGGLVLGTSNKTELLLGYGTQFGDMASAVNPIGDLYKTQLYPFARHLGAPPEILEKTPTGDLWIGQTDEGELGFSYAAVDTLLYRMVDCRWSAEELRAGGWDHAFIQQVMERVRRNHYKRRMPVIAKLSARTVDRDFRYSRDWGT
jgi:NAD+ synthase